MNWCARGYSVTLLDDLSTGKEESLAKVREQITFIQGTITDRQTVEKACRGADYVLHLAAPLLSRAQRDSLLETNQINVDGTLNVLVVARDAGVVSS
jgi:UDP-glucose 4-epimerase